MKKYNITEAIEIVNLLKDKLKHHNYGVGLTGGVLYNLTSDKDIDIILYPLKSKLGCTPHNQILILISHFIIEAGIGKEKFEFDDKLKMTPSCGDISISKSLGTTFSEKAKPSTGKFTKANHENDSKSVYVKVYERTGRSDLRIDFFFLS